MSGADAQQAEADADARQAGPRQAGTAVPVTRGRTVAGAALVVLGFSALFAAYGAAFGGLGELLLIHQRRAVPGARVP